jgi:ketosteroid isomerase-like protein
MTEPQAVNPSYPEALVKGYLKAFEARDLDRCLDYFADDGAVDFQGTLFRGREEVADWHRDRFSANLRVLRLESIKFDGDTVVIDVVIASDRLQAWKLKSLNGRITVRMEGDKIKRADFAARMTNIFDMLRAGE